MIRWLGCFFVFIFSGGVFAQFSLEKMWSVDTVYKTLKPSWFHNSPPLLFKKWVIQGNSMNGVQAFTQDQGRRVWKFSIQGGVTSPIVSFKQHIYFGGGDGFFYSLHAETGRLNWKFFTGSENTGAPLVHDGKVYWTTANQKMYALTLQGHLAWIYAGPSLSRDLTIRGRPRPVVFKNNIYVGFYDGSVVALHKRTGRLKWKKALFPQNPILSDLYLEGRCLFVSVFQSHLFCLNPYNGRQVWKTKGHAFFSKYDSLFYKVTDQKIQALDKVSRKEVWSQKISSPVLFPSFHKKYLVYGSLSDSKLYFLDRNTGNSVKTFSFGKGLSSSITVDDRQGDLYFLSVQGRLHKLRVHL